MKKLKFTTGKAAACLGVMCLLLVQGCKKDIIQPNSKDLQNGISIAEARAYFDAILRQTTKREKLMSTSVTKELSYQDFLANKQPIWDQAYEKMLTTGSSVKIPIDFGNAYAVINKEKKEVMPLSSLNYLFMYKDSLNAVHAEWIILVPSVDWLYGHRSEYTGKIIVKDWDGKIIKYLNYNHIAAINTASTIKGKLLSSIGKVQNTSGGENQMDQAVGFCTLWPTGKCLRMGVCAEQCDNCLEICARLSCTFFDCSPECDVEVKGGGGGGGGGESPGNPSGPGGGGAYPPDDCGGRGFPKPKAREQDLDGNMARVPPCIPKPMILMTLSLSNLIEKLGLSSESEQSVYLGTHPEIVDDLLLYLGTNGETPENIEFCRWAVGYLLLNKPLTFEQLLGRLMNKPFDFEPSQVLYIPRDREPASYYWRPKLNNGADFHEYLSRVPDEVKPEDLVNCHYYAFGDVPGALKVYGSPKHMLEFKLGPEWEKVKNGVHIKVGDRIGYYVPNQKGNGPAWAHSGIVIEVDAEGYATKIASKPGTAYKVIEHHPRDIPGDYGSTEPSFIVNGKAEASRIYYRKK